MSMAIPPQLLDVVKLGIEEMVDSTQGMTDYKLIAVDASGEKSITYASVVGFSGEQMKGSFVLCCEKDLLHRSHPNLAMDMPVGDPEIHDWIGEIANQMLGRIKNKLYENGVLFAMGTPTTVTGQDFQITLPDKGCRMRLDYQGSAGPMVVHFLTTISPGTQFTVVTKKEEVTAKEGDSFLF